MRGLQQLKNGTWRVNIMVHGERMSKTCKTFNEALHVSEYIRSFLKLKHQGQRGQIMYAINKNGQIENGGRIIANANEAAQNVAVGALQTFAFPATKQKIRIIQKDDGEPWFVAKDVADCLGYTNPQKAIIDHCKHAKILKGNETLLLTPSPRGLTVLPKSDVYRLLMRSKLPSAEIFQDWVMEEVLPTIERTGGYIIAQPEESPETLMARALFVAKDSIDRLNKQLEDAQPKIEAYEELYNSEGDCTLTEAAKHFDMSAQRLNAILREENWLFKNAVDKQGNSITPVHLPYQNIIDKGYVTVKSRTSRWGYRCTQSYITPRGLIAIGRVLHKRYDA